MNVFRFYKAVADNTYDDEHVDIDYVLAQLEEEDHPHFGPPLPPSIMDRVLMDIYAPALREALNRPSIMDLVRR